VSSPSPPTSSPTNTDGVAVAAVAFLSAGAVAVACYRAAGVSLGLFFGPLLLAPFLAPSLALAGPTLIRRIVVCAALLAGTQLIWMATANLSAFDALRCGGVYGVLVLALAGSATLLVRVGAEQTFAATITAVGGFAWLTWPVWLCPWLNGPHSEQVAAWLSFAHPMLAMNGILYDRFNAWDRYTIAYQQLTTLNQDVLYALPRRIFWCMAVHGAVAAAGFLPLSRKGFQRIISGKDSPIANRLPEQQDVG